MVQWKGEKLMAINIYISKSKAANPDVIIATKKAIKEYSIDIVILEYAGGQYNPDLKYKGDFCITIPPANVHIENGVQSVMLGRGGYDETELMDKAGKKVGIILLEKGQDPLDWKNLKIGIPIEYVETRENYQVNWGIITIGKEMSINEFLSGNSKKESDNSSDDELDELFV